MYGFFGSNPGTNTEVLTDVCRTGESSGLGRFHRAESSDRSCLDSRFRVCRHPYLLGTTLVSGSGEAESIKLAEVQVDRLGQSVVQQSQKVAGPVFHSWRQRGDQALLDAFGDAEEAADVAGEAAEA